MTPLRVLVVDDEPVATRRLSALLGAFSEVRDCASALGARDALALADAFRPNVVLLDIEMPGLNGLELAQHLIREDPVAIIFVTAFSQYAVEAFGLAAADYLLKPVDAARLRAALSRARERLEARTAAADLQALHAALAALRAREAERDGANALWIAEGGARQRVVIDAIVWVEAERDYIRLHTRQRSHLVRGSITDLARKLPQEEFVRVRRSALVRVACIERIECRGDRRYLIITSSGATIRVGRSHIATLRQLLARAVSAARASG